MDIDIDIDFLECGESFTVAFAEVAQGATKRCPNGHEIILVDDAGGAQELQRSLDNLDDSLKRFGN